MNRTYITSHVLQLHFIVTVAAGNVYIIVIMYTIFFLWHIMITVCFIKYVYVNYPVMSIQCEHNFTYVAVASFFNCDF